MSKRSPEIEITIGAIASMIGTLALLGLGVFYSQHDEDTLNVSNVDAASESIDQDPLYILSEDPREQAVLKVEYDGPQWEAIIGRFEVRHRNNDLESWRVPVELSRNDYSVLRIPAGDYSFHFGPYLPRQLARALKSDRGTQIDTTVFGGERVVVKCEYETIEKKKPEGWKEILIDLGSDDREQGFVDCSLKSKENLADKIEVILDPQPEVRELVTPTSGFLTPTRKRDFSHDLRFSWPISDPRNLVDSFSAELITAVVRGRIESLYGCYYSDSHQVTPTDSSVGSSRPGKEMIWKEVWRTGTAEFQDMAEAIEIPFKFREGYSVDSR